VHSDIDVTSEYGYPRTAALLALRQPRRKMPSEPCVAPEATSAQHGVAVGRESVTVMAGDEMSSGRQKSSDARHGSLGQDGAH